jgi:hypothetical protein
MDPVYIFWSYQSSQNSWSDVKIRIGSGWHTVPALSVHSHLPFVIRKQVPQEEN